MGIERTSAGRPRVRCDFCGKTLRAGMPESDAPEFMWRIYDAAIVRGWEFDPKHVRPNSRRPRRARCPLCVAGLCEACGLPNVNGYRVGHDLTRHHLTMTSCNEQAVQGFVPVPPILHDALADVLRDPVLACYRNNDDWCSLRFARVEHLEELAEIEHDESAALLAHVARFAAVSPWWVAWRDEVEPVLQRLDGSRRIVWRDGLPWPQLEPEIAAAWSVCMREERRTA